MTHKLSSEPCKCSNRYCYMLHHKIAESDRFEVMNRFLSEKYGLPVITKFGNCSSFLILIENKENWKKKSSCHVFPVTEEDDWAFLKIWISTNTVLHQERPRWYGNPNAQGKCMDKSSLFMNAIKGRFIKRPVEWLSGIVHTHRMVSFSEFCCFNSIL